MKDGGSRLCVFHVLVDGSRKGIKFQAGRSLGVHTSVRRKRLGSIALATAGLNPAVEVGSSLSFGGICGYCAGMFLKKVGRAAAVTCGAVFVLFQLAALKGYVEVRWDRIERDVMDALDLKRDGKLDSRDTQFALQKLVSVLTANMASTSVGFSAGLLAGWRAG